MKKTNLTSLIHIDTDLTDLLVQKLRSTANDFYDRVDYLYSNIAYVDWEGSAKDEYLYELYQCFSSLKNLSDQIDLLGFQMANEVDQWINVSSTFHT